MRKKRQFLLPSCYLTLEQSFASFRLEGLVLSAVGRKAEMQPVAVARRSMRNGSLPRNTFIIFSKAKCTIKVLPMFSVSPKDVNIFLGECLSSGCCNKIPQTEWLKQQTCISHSSGGWKSEIRVSAGVGSWWGLSSQFAMATFLLCPHVEEKEPCSLRPLIKLPSPSWGLPPHDLIKT